MANPERGEVALTITRNGVEKEYTLKMSMNAAVSLQTKRKKTINQIMDDVAQMDFASIRAMAFMLLQKYHAKEIDSEEKAGDLIDDAGGLVPFFTAFKSLMDINVDPAPAQEGTANPPETQADSTGDDSTLTPAAAA